ncbi:hypothetical protein LEN26_005792 [Aphanomyces euteiches]|nr:hypothetical protein AeMF1_015861 [Aphanomyces euteiches]KAH9137272.1 hypothetical protein LEN26_005792 [Aphanomyces euteiches]KAH9191136.1 hypothetical protein AeNC1_006891 [Aphanomyces euteiches]
MIPSTMAETVDNLTLEDTNNEQDIESEAEIKSPRSSQRQVNFSADLLERRQHIHDVPYSPPQAGDLHVFGVMHLIQTTIMTGGRLTPKIYAPRDIWYMDRVRLVGVDHKLRLLDACASHFTLLQSLPIPDTSENKAIFDSALLSLSSAFTELKAELIRPFPHLVPESQATVHEPTKIERDIVNAVGSNNTVGKLTSLAFGFGRMVRKQAVAVVERANSAQVETISKDALGRYAELIMSFFAQAQFLGVWLDSSYSPPSGTLDLQRHQAIGNSIKDTPRHKAVSSIATFLEEILCELVLRDVQSLLLNYLQRLSHAYGAFTIDSGSLVRSASA